MATGKKVMRQLSAILLLVGVGCAGSAMPQTQTQPKPAVQKPTAQKPAARVYYDYYEPSQRQRLRRETCGKEEVASAAVCVRKCTVGYLMEGLQPPRCRAINPLPPYSLPSSTVRKEVGIQPMPRPPEKPTPVKPGA